MSPLSFSFASRVAALYAGLFALVGIQLPFFPLWLTAKGLDAREIGIILAVPMVVRVFAIPAVARITEHTGALRGTIVAALALATLGYVLVGFADGFLAIAILVALAAGAGSPAKPLAETYELK